MPAAKEPVMITPLHRRHDAMHLWHEVMMARAVFGARPLSTPVFRLSVRAALLCGAFALAACEGGGLGGDGATRATGTGAARDVAARTVERDIEAPEVFRLEESGLWDGRPSLGGVWVAHPSATDPERVLIRNDETGETVIGALFRRERENPGPRFQISSEAANALGILPGQPTTIHVTALRLQQVEIEPDPEALAGAEAEATDDDAPARAEAVAEAAAEPDAESGAAETVEIADADDPAPRRGGLFGFLRRSAPETDTTAEPGAITETALDAPPAAEIAAGAAAEATAAAPAADALTDPAVAPPTAAPTADTAEPAPRERRGLRALFTRSTPAQTAPEPETTTLIPTPEAEAAAMAPAAAPDRPFVQIGIFSVEGNATAARDRMRRAGLPAEIRRGRVDDRQFWRVVVGPAASENAQADLLRQTRGMGFDDAYAVRR